MPNHILEQNATGSVPQPDPTLLTTVQLEKAIASVREILETRLDGNDKAITLLEAAREKTSDSIKEEVSHLKDLHSERFDGIAQRLADLVTQMDKIAGLNQTAITAALLAAKELVSIQNTSNTNAIDKSSAAFTKQIEGIVDLMRSNTKSTDDKYNDLKDRLTSIESSKKGSNEGIGMIGGLSLGIIALIAVIVAVAALVLPFMRAG